MVMVVMFRRGGHFFICGRESILRAWSRSCCSIGWCRDHLCVTIVDKGELSFDEVVRHRLHGISSSSGVSVSVGVGVESFYFEISTMFLMC